MNRLDLRLVGPETTTDVVDEPTGAPTVDELFRSYAPYVAAIGLRLLGRPDEVDDLVQDVFIDAFKSRRKLIEREAAKRWLAVVAVRKARRRLRKRRVRNFLQLDDCYDYSARVAPGISAEDMAFVGEIYRVLDGLPVQERLAWSLRHLQGERLERVATLSGCSLATAKRRIAAAQMAIEREIDRD